MGRESSREWALGHDGHVQKSQEWAFETRPLPDRAQQAASMYPGTTSKGRVEVVGPPVSREKCGSQRGGDSPRVAEPALERGMSTNGSLRPLGSFHPRGSLPVYVSVELPPALPSGGFGQGQGVRPSPACRVRVGKTKVNGDGAWGEAGGSPGGTDGQSKVSETGAKRGCPPVASDTA